MALDINCTIPPTPLNLDIVSNTIFVNNVSSFDYAALVIKDEIEISEYILIVSNNPLGGQSHICHLASTLINNEPDPPSSSFYVAQYKPHTILEDDCRSIQIVAAKLYAMAKSLK